MDDSLLQCLKNLVEQDGAMQAYACGRSVFVWIKLVDASQELCIWFNEGVVDAHATRPPGKPADVEISMRSEQFEAILGGKMNAYLAALNGKFRVEGDVLKATGLLKLIKDFSRLYALCCAGGSQVEPQE